MTSMSQDFEPGDKYASRWKKTSTGSLVAQYKDCSAEVQALLKDVNNNKAKGELEGFFFSRSIGEYGDNVFRSTKEEHDQWRASYRKGHPYSSGGARAQASQAQTRIDTMPESEYKSLTARATTPPNVGWSPPQFVLIPLRTLDDETGWETVKHNKQTGWKSVKVVEIENYYAVIMKRD